MAKKEYIDRETAIEIVKINHGDYVGAVLMLRTRPAADVRPERRGEWRISRDGYYYCSKCGEELKNGIIFNFCPHCGAKMSRKDGN